MITTDQQYSVTRAHLAEFQTVLAALKESSDPVQRRLQMEAVRSQIVTFERDLALWEAGIQEPVPGTPDPAMLDLPAGADTRAGIIALKRAEIANIDRQIGIALDRIADWRRHRTWLEHEITTLEAEARELQPQYTHVG